MKANALVQFVIGGVLALALVGACGKPEVEAESHSFQVVRTVETTSWSGRAQVVKDPISERCYLRSSVHGGWSYLLLPDCK